MFEHVIEALLTHKQLIIVGLAITGLAFYTGVPSNMAAFADHTGGWQGIVLLDISDPANAVDQDGRFTHTFEFGFGLLEESLEEGPFSFAFDDQGILALPEIDR